jgi:hypothetical protein
VQVPVTVAALPTKKKPLDGELTDIDGASWPMPPAPKMLKATKGTVTPRTTLF